LISENELLSAYRETVRRLYGFVARRTGGGQRALVEDIVQETYLRAVKHWSKDGLPDKPLAWLQTVAGNLVASYYRRIQPEPLQDNHPEPIDHQVESPLQADSALLRKGLANLGNGQAQLLQAFHLEERSIRQIAGELGVSERAVEGRLRRARVALRARLQRLLEGGKK
jgi:RNA polymerase sigma-70 factor (ECF subfamily)